MTSFTPIASLLGGILIGMSAVALMASHGRIAGISGIVSRLLPPYQDGQSAGRLAFVLGLVLAPLAAGLLADYPVTQTVSHNLPMMALAGLLVGFGTVWGNGCTSSGHGFAGSRDSRNGRSSRRSSSWRPHSQRSSSPATSSEARRTIP
jgi:uncharacterized membrane protein YedE/YeeE